MTGKNSAVKSPHITYNPKPKKKSLQFLWVPLLGFLFGLISIGLIFFILDKQAGTSFTSPLSDRLNLGPKVPTPTPGPKQFSLLLLGYGGGTHEGGYLTDTIMQVAINPKDKTILLISIPRDLFVQIPLSDTQTEQEKINAAFVVGMDDKTYPNKPHKYLSTVNPGALPEEVVSEVTGIHIDSYVALSFDGFTKAIDALGGIDVNFPYTFDDYHYPVTGKEDDTCGKTKEEVASLSSTLKGDDLESQFPCRYEHLHVSKGVQHIDGTFALKVARSRHSATDGGDFERATRQRLILEAVKERVFAINFLPKAIPFFMSLGQDLHTDIDVSTIQSFLSFASELKSYKIKSIALTDENVLMSGTSDIGAYILRPTQGLFDWNQTKQFIAEEATKSADMQPQSATPSSTPGVKK